MTKIIRPGSGVLYMKVGTHAQEGLDDIVRRKLREIERTGYGMWGYGGNTCHPSSMVRPFAKDFAKHGPIYLVMEEMDSKHFAEPLCATEYSIDGSDWREIPDTIQVRGSRYALVIKDLHKEEFNLPLARTRVPVGPSAGRLGSDYLTGRVDKACLEVLPDTVQAADSMPLERRINLVAELEHPYAVFLRNYG